MFIFYDLIFLLVVIGYLPFYLFRKKSVSSLLARLGFLPKGLKLDRPIWIHAVSVGEVMAIRNLADELRKIYPEKKLVISTITPTGNKIAVSIAQEGDFVTYVPLDFSFIVRRVLNRINPSIFIIAETEIWPNLIHCLFKKNIPIITVNGRISDNSFKGYLRIRPLLKTILKKVSLFCVQTERDRERLLALGVTKEKIKVSGNMKFDAASGSLPPQGTVELKATQEEKLFVAGSTHPTEEEMILGAYKKLCPDFPGLRLLLAPRHPERSKEIAQAVSALGFRPVFISSFSSLCPTCITKPVFILDTIGQLVSFYAQADIVFVGGSFIKKGGHNILEPLAQGKPTLFGPHMFNFRDIADLFLSNHAAIMVADIDELGLKIAELLRNPAQAELLAKAALEIIRQNQGASKRNAEYIKAVVS